MSTAAPAAPPSSAAAAPAETATSGAASAEVDPFDDLHKKRRFGWVWVVLVLAAAGVGAFFYVRHLRKPVPPRFLTARVTRGDVIEKIEATGTVQPLTQVQVSSQVSGRVRSIAADFNSQVHAGDLLAELDPEPFEAAMGVARASLAAAQAQLARNRVEVTLQERNLARAQDLRSRQLNAQADVDTAMAARDAARAQIGVSQADVARTRAQLDSAQQNMRYSRIFAPIDGVVITRSVDTGQTVAASLSAPVLFLIANDLRRMQILADIDEADVGRMHEQLAVDARVEAFPGDTFHGTVRRVRYAPTTTSGVVTYPAVIDVANEELKLRPGMTATVTVVTNRRTAVLRVPNAALRFRPPAGAGGSAGGGRRRGSGEGGGEGGGGGRRRNGGEGAPAGASASAAGGSAAPGDAAEDPSAPSGRGSRSGRIYVLRNGAPVPMRVRTGATDGTLTEIEAEGLTENTEVVTEQIDEAPRGASGGGAVGSARPSSGGGRRMF